MYNNNYGEIGNIRGNFIGNYASCYPVGGFWAVRFITITMVKSAILLAIFIANYASGFYAMEGRLIIEVPLVIGSGDFVGNYAFGIKICLWRR